MHPSQEFKRFGKRFIQDIDLFASNIQELYDFVLNPFTGEERVRLRDFLDLALKESISDEELQRLWNSVDADIYFHAAKDLRTMLEGARDRL